MVFDTRYNKGFTLAETLIALVVVGIVAAITVPTLVTRYQKEQTVTQLKKAYSALSQTTARAIADNGPISTWDMGAPGDTDAIKAFLNKYVLPYMSISTELESHHKGWWPVEYVYLNNEPYDLNQKFVMFVLSDGTIVYTSSSQRSNGEKRVSFNVDINGAKKPNKVGKDFFFFTYYLDSPSAEKKGKILANDFDLSRSELAANKDWRCHKGKTGDCCAALIIKDGWKISDDYPW